MKILSIVLLCFIYNITFTIGSDTVNYLVISTKKILESQIKPNFNDFKNYKESQGVKVRSVYLSNILKNNEGRDEAERLRNFIKYTYLNWKIKYVLLVGDGSILPTRLLYVGNEGILSDYYFSHLNGSYDFNNNSIFGEINDGPNGGLPDDIAEIAIGRVPIKSGEEFSNFIYKNIKYNETRDIMYHRNMLLVGENLGENIWGGDLLENVWDHYISRVGPVSYISLLEKDKSWRYDDILRILNNDSVSIINYIGHTYYWMAFKRNLKFDQFKQLKNKRPFFLYSEGGYAGNFYFESIANYLIGKNRSGAFAMIANSRERRIENHNHYVAFWKLFNHNQENELGQINNKVHQYLAKDSKSYGTRWVNYQTNLLGDPHLKLKVPLENYINNEVEVSKEEIGKESSLEAENIVVNTFINQEKKLLLFVTNSKHKELHYQIETYPTHGEITGEPPNIIYTPLKNFIGEDIITYSVSNSPFEGVATGEIKINIIEEKERWITKNIGDYHKLGKVIDHSEGIIISGGGEGILKNKENLYFSGRIVKGNFELEIELGKGLLLKEKNQFGLMLRDKLLNDSKMISFYLNKIKRNYIKKSVRKHSGDVVLTEQSITSIFDTGLWLKIKRINNKFTLESSFDGKNWNINSEEIMSLNESIYAGIFIASGNINKVHKIKVKQLAYRKFEN